MFFNKNDSDSKNHEAPETKVLPLLPLRDIIVFPHMVVPLFVGREKSINALEEAMENKKEILLAAQKQAKTNDPTPDDIFSVGTVGAIIQLLRLPDGTIKVLVEGKRRARIESFIPKDDFFLCSVSLIEEVYEKTIETEALVRSVQSTFENYVKLNKRIPPEMLVSVQTVVDPARLADTIVVYLGSIKLIDRQEILETSDPIERLTRLYEMMNAEIEILQVEKKIRTRVKKQMERTQKEYYLNEQMQAIQKELGERDEFKNELQELEEKIENKKCSLEAKDKLQKELKKLKLMQPMSAEATVVRNYVDWVLSLPWEEKSEENRDIALAEKILEEDHYGLKKVKERILEYLAVQALTGKLKGPVLCLVGPPGTGKTSLGKSIARATSREFVRLSLGGVRDEAEIRGHRRTYIGALPGRIIQRLRKAGTNNPVFLLDEVDKMSSDFRGDPASALLEVLDGEQNHCFNDHYLDLDYDLSDIMFVTTANSLSGIPMPLRDRMEIIDLSGYTEFEKLNIAVRYLIPRQRAEAGLKDSDIEITENAVRTVIHHYTHESGVRNLERELGSICRKVARKIVGAENPEKLRIAAQSVPKYLGVPKYRPDKTSDKDEIGLTNGLAYTEYGGAILQCEVAVVPGKGELVITGLLEKGMKESAQAAMSYIRSRHKLLGIAEDFYQKNDYHIHFPEFIPKDGPSAGITMATSIASSLMKIPVRRKLAMTGEITLRGRVLPIGGLKEKMLAAHRAGITTLLIPKDNRKDLRDIPKRVLKETRIVLIEHMDEVLREALCLSDPDEIFGRRVPPVEYINGELVVGNRVNNEPADVLQPTVEPPGARQ
jgi:ATP-dependent Lon protease